MMADKRSIFIKIEDPLDGTYNIAEITWLGEVKFMTPVTKIEHYHIRRIADVSLLQNASAYQITEEMAIKRGYKKDD